MQPDQLREEVLRALTSNARFYMGLKRIRWALSTPLTVTDDELMSCLAELIAVGKLETTFNKHLQWKLRTGNKCQEKSKGANVVTAPTVAKSWPWKS